MLNCHVRQSAKFLYACYDQFLFTNTISVGSPMDLRCHMTRLSRFRFVLCVLIRYQSSESSFLYLKHAKTKVILTEQARRSTRWVGVVAPCLHCLHRLHQRRASSSSWCPCSRPCWDRGPAPWPGNPRCRP